MFIYLCVMRLKRRPPLAAAVTGWQAVQWILIEMLPPEIASFLRCKKHEQTKPWVLKNALVQLTSPVGIV
jgi:hypothetical protein